MRIEAKYEYGVLTLNRVFDSLEEHFACDADEVQEDMWCGSMDYHSCMEYVGECRVPRHIQMSIPDFRPRIVEPMNEDVEIIPF